MGDETTDVNVFLLQLGVFGVLAIEGLDIRGLRLRERHKSDSGWPRNMKRLDRFFYWTLGGMVLSIGTVLAIDGATGFYLFAFMCGMLGCLLDMSATLVHCFQKRHKPDAARYQNMATKQQSVSCVSVFALAIIIGTLLSGCVYLIMEEVTGFRLFPTLIITLVLQLKMSETLAHYLWGGHKPGPVWYLNMTSRQRSISWMAAAIVGIFLCVYLAWL